MEQKYVLLECGHKVRKDKIKKGLGKLVWCHDCTKYRRRDESHTATHIP